MLVADAVAPAQAAGDARKAPLQFERHSTSGFHEFEPAKIARAPASLPGSMHVELPAEAQIATEFLRDAPALIARCASWCKSWRLPLSRLQIVILGLVIADAAIIGWRADLVRAMPQTATFYARLGLPVNVRGLRFDRVAATAEWRDGKPVLIVKGEISNDTIWLRKCRVCVWSFETPSTRKSVSGTLRRHGKPWRQARRCHFVTNLLCRRRTRARSWSGSSIVTTAFDAANACGRFGSCLKAREGGPFNSPKRSFV